MPNSKFAPGSLMRLGRCSATWTGILFVVLCLSGVSLHATLPKIKASLTQLQKLENIFPLQNAYYAVYGMQAMCDQADQDYQNGGSTTAEDLVKIHALMKIAAVIIGYQDLYDVHDELMRQHSRDLSVPPDTILAKESMPTGTLQNLHREYEIKQGDFRLESAAFEVQLDRSPALVGLRRIAVEVAGSKGSASIRARRFAESLTLQFQNPIARNFHIKYYVHDAAQLNLGIRPTDYFFVPPKQQAKQTWMRQKATEFRGTRIIDLESGIPGGKMYIPPGEYTISVGGTPPKGRSAFNLAVEGPGTQVLGYKWRVTDSNFVEVTEITPPDRSFGSFKEFFPKFKLLGFQLGTNTRTKSLEGDAGARMFHRFNRNVALQSQAQVSFRSHRDFFDLDQILPEPANFVDRERRDLADFGSTELQFDVGPVFRFGDFQVAAMQSIRYVDRDRFDTGGTLGQFFFNVGYLFSRGQAGFYATKANLDEPLVKTVQFDDVFFEETYLKVMDQVGVNFQVSVTDRSYVEGAFGYMSSAVRSNVPGGVFRYIMPRLWKKIGLAAEIGYNESFVGNQNSMRVGFGLRFDDWSRPSTFREEQGPVPVFVPRVRYETLTRVVRRGNQAPIADAGPDQLDLNPFTRVILDGTGSSDPEGDTLDFRWTLLEDCPGTIVLEGNETSNPSFVIGNGEKCTLQLVAKDTFGAESFPDLVVVSSIRTEQPVIHGFSANPAEIRQNETSLLEWEVTGAATITISNVPASTALDPENGSVIVRPQDTTVYFLTACNEVKECVNAQATVVVRPDLPEIVRFTATPPEIRVGDCSVLQWETGGASRVSVSNITINDAPVEVSPSDQLVVCPQQTTTYSLTATNDRGEIVSSSVTVLVRPNLTLITQFTANPPEIRQGETTDLCWTMENAVAASITNSSGGTVNLTGDDLVSGCRTESPQGNTTYTLSGSNEGGEIVTASVTVRVRSALPRIVEFTAQPAEIRQGESTDLCWTMENAVAASITNSPGGTVNLAGDDLVSGCRILSPQGTTTYTLSASNETGEIVTVSVTVLVRPALPRIVGFTATPSEIRIGKQSLLTWATENADTLTLTNSNGGVLPTSGANGSLSVTSAETTTYTLTATNSAGESVSAAVTVVVKPPLPVITSFTASLVDPNDNVINPGDPVLLEWETNADQHPSLVVSITNIGDSLPPSGSAQVGPQSTTLYTLTVSNGAGEVVTAAVIVEVILQPPTILQFTCAPSSVPSGGDAQISWVTSDAQTVSLTNLTTGSTIGSGLPASGSLTLHMATRTTFRLTATSPQNLTAEADCTVNVF